LLQDVAQQNTYIDFAWFVSSESGNDSLPSASPSEWPSIRINNLRRRPGNNDGVRVPCSRPWHCQQFEQCGGLNSFDIPLRGSGVRRQGELQQIYMADKPKVHTALPVAWRDPRNPRKALKCTWHHVYSAQTSKHSHSRDKLIIKTILPRQIRPTRTLIAEEKVRPC
jgi:hypothetical protein